MVGLPEIVERVGEPVTSSLKALPGRLGGDSEDVPDLWRRQALPGMELKDLPVTITQPAKDGQHEVALGCRSGRPLNVAGRPRVALQAVNQGTSPPVASVVVGEYASGRPKEPETDFIGRRQIRDASPSHLERLSNHVLGILSARAPTQGIAEQIPVVRLKRCTELGLRVHIAPVSALRPSAFYCIHVHSTPNCDTPAADRALQGIDGPATNCLRQHLT